MKNILITGVNSYIGDSVENWLMKDSSKYNIHTVDMRNKAWKKEKFSDYEVVFHVAGIAHVSSDSKMEELYYRVNRDLTIETAEKAKMEGVKQFIFMSSIIVYGDSSSSRRVINNSTVPAPSNFYGNSKYQAEEILRKLESTYFKVVIIRPPMIYGKGSRGNYPRLAKMAQSLPFFPNFDNERSMLHIDNLCEFIRLIINNGECGLFFPQNKEYVKTSDMVKFIAEVHGKKIRLIKMANPIIRLLFPINIVRKVFGNLVYDKSMSEYSKGEYCIRTFEKSIELTESKDKSE